MEYKGYEARVVFDEDARVFHGKVINTRDVITFQGSSVDELERHFTIRWMITWNSALIVARSRMRPAATAGHPHSSVGSRSVLTIPARLLHSPKRRSPGGRTSAPCQCSCGPFGA